MCCFTAAGGFNSHSPPPKAFSRADLRELTAAPAIFHDRPRVLLGVGGSGPLRVFVVSTRSAVSLVEVLVASAILAMCLIPVIAFSQRGLSESGHTQQEILGRLLLMDFCERFKGCPLVQLKQVAVALTADPHHLDKDPLLIPKKSIVPRFLKDIVRSLTVEENAKSLNGLHRVTFKVSYTRTSVTKDVERSMFLQRVIHEH